jgi:hypothetical protein
VSGYPFIDPKAILAVLGDNIFLEWEEGSETYKGTLLKRPDTYKPNHHTGIVIKAGPLVDPEILAALKKKKGGPVRILFDRFSGVEGYQDPVTKKRYAFIQESKQGSAYAIIPPRADGQPVTISGGEGDFDYAH